MSTKPTTVPRWATDLTNNTAPLSGQQDTGWTIGQDGVSSYDNWFKYWCYKWFQWLDEGDINFADLLVSGSTTYTGSVDYSWTGGSIVMDPQGTGDVVGIHTIYAQPTNLVVHALHGLVAGVDGQEIDIINDNDTYGFYLVHDSGTAAAGQKLRLPQAYTQANAAGNQVSVSTRGSIRVRYNGTDGYWEVIRFSGCYSYRCVNIPATASSIPTGATHSVSTSRITINGTGAVSIPLSLPARSLFDKFIVYVKKNTDATNTISAQLYTRAGNSDTESTVGTDDTDNTNAPGYTTLTDSPSAIVQDSNAQYWIRFDTAGGTTPAADWLVSTDVFYWALI